MFRPLLAMTALALVAPATAQTPPVPLIPRAKLFGNPTKTAAQLSPDGKWLSFIAPRDGVLNIWVAPIGNTTNAKPLTAEKSRPIRQYFWSPDSRQILFVNDKGGDENFLLYGVDVATAQERNYTPFTKTRAEIINVSSEVTDRILVGLNNRDPRYHDLYSLDLASAKLTLLFQNDVGYSYVADQQLTPRLAVKELPSGGRAYYRITGGKVEAAPFSENGLEDALTTGPAGYTSDGKTLYWLDSRGRDTSALVAMDVASGTTSIIAEDSLADISGILADPKTGRVQAYAANYLKPEWKPVGGDIAADLAFLKSNLKGDFQLSSRTDADDLWVLTVDPVSAPASAYLYARKTKKLTQLFVFRPELANETLAPMYAYATPRAMGSSWSPILRCPRAAIRMVTVARTLRFRWF